MTKKYAKLALVYAIVAIVFGVFYREFTKFSGFSGRTSLGFMHTHYFILGMVFFLVLMLIEKNFTFSDGVKTSRVILTYQIGLNITGLGFLLRGLMQVTQTPLSVGMEAGISGISGIGHIILGISLIILLLQIKKKA